jgi:diadenosine tetraphosphatase ApaH/serine/threonine PP2A family protein phosphatase
VSRLGSTIRGIAASGPGTLAMDTWLYRGYRRDGGTVGFPEWESSEGIDSWDKAPAPALVAKRLLEAVLHHDLPPKHARALNNLTHWGFGLGAGAAYGLFLASRGTPKLWYGPPFGAAVWGFGYVVLPVLGVYKPIWKYDLETLAKDLSAHLVFGTATTAAFRLLPHRREHR